MDVAMVGLGRMGGNMARRLSEPRSRRHLWNIDAIGVCS